MNENDLKITRSQHGFWYLEGDTHIGTWCEENGRLDHDRYLIPFATSYMKEGDAVLDLGCYIGDHTIAYKEAVGETGLVVGVDANDVALQCAEKNVDALFISAFISEKMDDAAFVAFDDKNYGASTIADESETLSLGNIVNSITIDHIVDTYMGGRCDFIKMDVEGYEVFALLGGAKTIATLRPKLLIEVNNNALSKHGFGYETIIAALDSYGYSWKIVQDIELSSPQYDLICLPKEVK